MYRKYNMPPSSWITEIQNDSERININLVLKILNYKILLSTHLLALFHRPFTVVPQFAVVEIFLYFATACQTNTSLNVMLLFNFQMVTLLATHSHIGTSKNKGV